MLEAIALIPIMFVFGGPKAGFLATSAILEKVDAGKYQPIVDCAVCAIDKVFGFDDLSEFSDKPE